MTTTCILCGCDDFHACQDEDGTACHWSLLDSHGLHGDPFEFGVCSACEHIDTPITDGMTPASDADLATPEASRLILPGDDGFYF